MMMRADSQCAPRFLASHTMIRSLKRSGGVPSKMLGLKQWGTGSRTSAFFCSTVHHRIVIGKLHRLGPDCLSRQFSPEITVGDDCYIGPACQFHSVKAISLGNGCVLSDQVYVSDVGHSMGPRAGLITDQAVISKGPLRLGQGCFVGFGSTILSGVLLGRHCVVGAHSVVTRSFDAYTMLAGNPARAIARFDLTTGEWVRLEPVRQAKAET